MVDFRGLFYELFWRSVGPYVSADELQASANDENTSRKGHTYAIADLRKELKYLFFLFQKGRANIYSSKRNPRQSLGDGGFVNPWCQKDSLLDHYCLKYPSVSSLSLFKNLSSF